MTQHSQAVNQSWTPVFPYLKVECGGGTQHRADKTLSRQWYSVLLVCHESTLDK